MRKESGTVSLLFRFTHYIDKALQSVLFEPQVPFAAVLGGCGRYNQKAWMLGYRWAITLRLLLLYCVLVCNLDLYSASKLLQ